MSDLDVTLDRPYAQQAETRAAAVRYLKRTGNADVLEALGLVADPVAEERGRAKALAELKNKRMSPAPGPARAGYCPICQNKLPGHGVCRRSTRCREVAAQREAGGIE